MSSLLLTLRLHRVEVVVVAAVTCLLALSTLIVTGHVEAAVVSDACADEYYTSGKAVDTIGATCRREVFGFWAVRDESDFIRGTAALAFPWLIGLALGLPIVSRELETGTASLAWSLQGRRSTWLLARIVPLLGLALLAALIIGLLLGRMTEAAAAFDPIRPELRDLGRAGILVATRTLAAFGLGLLCGAVIGRSSVAAIVGLALSFVLFGSLTLGLQSAASQAFAIWLPAGADDESPWPSSMVSVDRGWADSSEMTPPRDILQEDELIERWRHDVCPTCAYPDVQSREGRTASAEFDGWLEDQDEYTRWARVVPLEAYDDYERVEATAGALVGVVTILLAFAVVSRRRPR